MNIQLKVPKPILDNMYEKMTFAIPNFENSKYRCVGILSISRKIFIVRDISTSIKNHIILKRKNGIYVKSSFYLIL